MTKDQLVVGGKYNWMYQPERLIYVGVQQGWYQFQKIGDPRSVWCEVRVEDLSSFEESK